MTFTGISLFAQLSQEERTQARSIWLKGFEVFDKAEKFQKQNQLPLALEQFKESLQYFERVKFRYPKWNSSLISYRVKLCRRKISDLKVEISKKPATGTPTAIPGKELLATKDRLDDTELKLQQTTRKLDTTLRSLELARREAARSSKSANELKGLLKEKSELETRCALLKNENQQLQKQISEKPDEKKWQASLGKNLKQIESLKKAQKEQVAQIDGLKNKFQSVSQEKMQLRFSYQKLQDQEKQWTADQKKATEFNESLQEKMDNYRKKSLKLTDEVRDVRKLLVKGQENNESLRTDLKDLRKKADAGAIAKQLEADNEILIKDLETLHLQMAKLKSEKRESDTNRTQVQNKLAKIEKLAANIEVDRKKVRKDLEIVEKKLMMSDTVEKKQQKIISDLRGRNQELLKENMGIAEKYAKAKKKEESFTELVQRLNVAQENNRSLNEKIVKIDNAQKKAVKARDNAVTSQNGHQEKYKKLSKLRRQLEKHNMKLITELEKAKRYRKQAEKTVGLQKDIDELNQHKKDSVMQIAKLNSEVGILKKVVSDKDRLLQDAKQRLNTQGSEKQKTGELVKKLNSANRQVSKLEDDLKKVRQAKLGQSWERDKKRYEEVIHSQNLEIASLKKRQKQVPTATVPEPKIAPDHDIKKLLKAAKVAESTGNKETSIWHYEKILTVAPENITALSRLGIISAEKGDDKKAIKLLEKALLFEPDDIDKLLILSFAYLRLGRNYLALGTLGKATAQDPRNPDMQYYLGVACSSLDWTQAAERQFLKTLKLDPKSKDAAFNLAVLLATSDQERMPEAREWYKKAKSLGAETDPGMEALFK